MLLRFFFYNVTEHQKESMLHSFNQEALQFITNLFESNQALYLLFEYLYLYKSLF